MVISDFQLYHQLHRRCSILRNLVLVFKDPYSLHIVHPDPDIHQLSKPYLGKPFLRWGQDKCIPSNHHNLSENSVSCNLSCILLEHITSSGQNQE